MPARQCYDFRFYSKIAPCNNNVQISMKEEKKNYWGIFFSLYLLFGDSETDYLAQL